MKTNNKTKLIDHATLERLNPCPYCGHKTLAILEDDDKCQLGCIRCGVHKGVATYEKDATWDIEDRLKERWNYRFLEGEVCDDALVEMDVPFNGYGVVNTRDGHLEHFAPDFQDVLGYIENDGGQNSYYVYRMIDCIWQRVEGSFLIWNVLDTVKQ